MPSRTFKKLKAIEGRTPGELPYGGRERGHGALHRGTVSLDSSMNVRGDQRFLCSLSLMLIF